MRVQYSPFNKTYKYMVMQNQLAHLSNLRKTTGLMKQDLTIHSLSYLSKKNIEKNQRNSTHLNSSKNYSIFENNNDKITKENQRLAKKLSKTTCRVMKRSDTQRQYKKYQQYKKLIRKYSSKKRKDLVYFPYQSLTSSRLRITAAKSKQFCTVNIPQLSKTKVHRYNY